VLEKKTAETTAARAADGVESWSTGDFRLWGGEPQQRYEGLRAYMLLPSDQRPRTTSARFDIGRVERFGLLGLLERDPVGDAWIGGSVGDFQVQLIPVGTANAQDRWGRLFAVLSALLTTTAGETHDSCGTLRPCIDRNAGEGTDDSESAERDYGIR